MRRGRVEPIASSTASYSWRRESRVVRRRAHVDVREERHPTGGHDLEATVEHRLLQFELGDAVTKEPADRVTALKDVDVVADADQLRGRGEAGRARADDRDPLARADVGRVRDVKTVREGVFGDLVLDPLDRDGTVRDPKDAGRLTGGGAEPAGELREVVGVEELFGGLGPV